LVMRHGWWLFDTTLLPHGPTPNDALFNFGFRDHCFEAQDWAALSMPPSA
jgi:hypothetical protein